MDDLSLQWAEFRRESAAILKTYQDGEKLAKSKDYTPEAQARQVAMHRANYDRAMAELLGRADVWLKAQKNLLTIAQRKARANELEAKRQLLGDTVMLRIYERRIESATTADLASWAASAPQRPNFRWPPPPWRPCGLGLRRAAAPTFRRCGRARTPAAVAPCPRRS